MTTINAINSSYPFSVANGGTGSGSLTAHGILIGEGTSAINPIVLTNGQLLVGSTGLDPVAATLSAGTGISITNGAGTITIATSGSTGGGFTWNDVTTTSATLAGGNAYIADNAALVTFTLPATANVGDAYIIVGKGAGGWTLVENALQSINFGTITTTVATGSLSSTNYTDSITFVCTTANIGFTVFNSVGNIAYI